MKLINNKERGEKQKNYRPGEEKNISALGINLCNPLMNVEEILSQNKATN